MKPSPPTKPRGTLAPLLTVLALSVACSSSSDHEDPCTPDDADGIISEPASLQLTVTDSEFMPKILSVQNSSDITLTLENRGTSPHGFVVDCLPTPNSDGCPTESCFPSDAKIDAISPGESQTIEFLTPLVEGIYDFHSNLAEDSGLSSGQFIVQ